MFQMKFQTPLKTVAMLADSVLVVGGCKNDLVLVRLSRTQSGSVVAASVSYSPWKREVSNFRYISSAGDIEKFVVSDSTGHIHLYSVIDNKFCLLDSVQVNQAVFVLKQLDKNTFVFGGT